MTNAKHKATPNARKRTTLVVIALLVLAACVGGYFAYQSIQNQKYSSAHVNQVMPYAREYGLDPLLVAAVVTVESNFDTDAVSSAGAVGLMQIMPDTGEWLATKLDIVDYSDAMLTNSNTNLRMGTWYLNFLLDRYDGNRTTALAAYNAGQGNVDSWLAQNRYSSDGQTLDSIPAHDAQDYVEKVENAYALYQKYET